MTPIASPPAAAQAPWTCPFCPLLCDTFQAVPGPDTLTLVGSDCPRARAALAQFTQFTQSSHAATLPPPQVDGVPADLDAAIAAAARCLLTSRQPLFGGLGTDVAGARALYRLACETGAICDAAHGGALTEGLRALQDRGGFTTTLAEVRTRADLVVCVGGLPTEHYPEFFNRCGLAASDARVVLLDAAADEGDLFDTVAQLAAQVEWPHTLQRAGATPRIAALAQRLLGAKYAVIVYETGRLPAHAALIIEALQRIVGTLNRSTRAATLALGGGDGASTVNQVFTWLSGLPLRSRAGPLGLEHEPLRFDAQQLLEDGAVDALLWVASFGAQPLPASAASLPRIVLGHPVMAADALVALAEGVVFIPVATPGIGAAGHLFRTDGSVLMPLRAIRAGIAGIAGIDHALPSVADVIGRITHAVLALRGGNAS